MMATVKCESISPAAFASFGRLVERPAPGTSMPLLEELENLRDHASIRVTLIETPPTKLPLEAIEMERHIFSSQAFLPMSGQDYLIIVAENDAADRPDLAKLKTFRVPGDTGIIYKPNTWHHPIASLDGKGHFAVFTFVDGTAEDEQFVKLPENIVVEPSNSAAHQ